MMSCRSCDRTVRLFPCIQPDCFHCSQSPATTRRWSPPIDRNAGAKYNPDRNLPDVVPVITSRRGDSYLHLNQDLMFFSRGFMQP